MARYLKRRRRARRVLRRRRRVPLRKIVNSVRENKWTFFGANNSGSSATKAIPIPNNAWQQIGWDGGGTTPINYVTQGYDHNQRIGNRYTLKSVEFMGLLWLLSGTSTAYYHDTTRLVVIRNKRPGGPSGQQVNMGTLMSVVNPFSCYNPDVKTRYQVLYDKTFVLNPSVYDTTTSTMVGYAIPVHFRIPLFGKMVIYSDTGATIASIVENSIEMYAISAQGTTQIQGTFCVMYWE